MSKLKLEWYHIVIIVAALAAGGFLFVKSRDNKKLKKLSKEDNRKINELGDRVMELENENLSKDRTIDELQNIIEDFNSNNDSLELELSDEVPEGFQAVHPQELKELDIVPGEGKPEKNNDSESNEYIFTKIPWPWGKEKLYLIFNQLSKPNHEGVPYLTKEEIDVFLKNNFSCFDDEPTGKIFTPNLKNKYTLEYFFYQVYELFKTNKTDIDYYANLLINNFTQWQNSNFNNLKKNMGRQGRKNLSRAEMKASPYHLILEMPS